MIEIGKAIYYLLSTDASVKAKVGTKIFPLIAENGTSFPFICYKRNSLTPTNSKDKFICNCESIFEIQVADSTYNGSCDLAELVITALEGKKGNINNVEIINIEFVDASEDYNEDTYIQTITFKIKIK